MKNIVYGLAFAMIVTFSACDDMLDIAPISEVAADSYYENAEQINTALMGVYSGMHKPLEHEWMLTEIRTDNSYQQTTGSSNEFSLFLNDLDMFRPTASIPAIYDYWYGSYQNISSANRVIGSVKVVEEEELKGQYEGEARFIRAYHYFNLVRLYGPVFLTTELISPLEARKMNRASVNSIYEVIIDDLKFSAENLPANYNSTETGRITNWAAKTMLAKVYMTLHQNDLALPLLLDVKDNSPHELLDKYEDVFSIQDEMNDEIIFAVRYKSGGYGLGSPFANFFAPSQSGAAVVNGDGSGYNYPSESFMNGYEANDSRKDATVDVWKTKNYVKKFLSEVSLRYDAENDFPVLRYADVLLMLAEIYNEDAGPADALPLVNRVRDRAGLDPLDPTISQFDCRLAIENERRFEFAFENQRWFDLVRTNRVNDVVKTQIESLDWDDHYKAYAPALRPDLDNIVQDWQLLLPIPQKEIDTNNELVITQNLGY